MNSSKQGWVRLHRRIEDNPLWFSEPFTRGQAWVDLFLFANHKSGHVLIRGNRIPIERGQLGWSELTMCKRWGWSKNKVRRFLNYLKTEHQISQVKFVNLTSITTIIKYEEFQQNPKKVQQTKHQTIPQTIHEQEVKKEKKTKREGGDFKSLKDIMAQKFSGKIKA